MGVWLGDPGLLPIPPRLLTEAHLELVAFQRALKEYVLTVDDAYGKQFEEFHVGFEGR